MDQEIQQLRVELIPAKKIGAHVITIAQMVEMENRPDSYEEPGEGDVLTWEDSYAIARALHRRYPHINLEEVSLGMIYKWTVVLPDFEDDRELANESILSAIYQEWFEEVTPL